jgi:hypothetical protein
MIPGAAAQPNHIKEPAPHRVRKREMLSSRFPIFRRPRRPIEPQQPPVDLADRLLPIGKVSQLELLAWLMLRM